MTDAPSESNPIITPQGVSADGGASGGMTRGGGRAEVPETRDKELANDPQIQQALAMQ